MILIFFLLSLSAFATEPLLAYLPPCVRPWLTHRTKNQEARAFSLSKGTCAREQNNLFIMSAPPLKIILLMKLCVDVGVGFCCVGLSPLHYCCIGEILFQGLKISRFHQVKKLHSIAGRNSIYSSNQSISYRHYCESK